MEVPDLTGDACCLTRTPYCYYFKEGRTARYVEQVFRAVVRGMSARQLGQVHLSRYDLFHGHLFRDHVHGHLGVLLHCKEYPAFDPALFPVALGYCQQGSDVAFDQQEMDRRNVVLYQGRLCVLDVGLRSPLYEGLLMEGTQEVRTVYEEDLGEPLGDVNFLMCRAHLPAAHRVLVCI